ncbi:hypothetical protein [Leptospira interrogans]|uniref:hypothetical protein n=1 Tax=Leptospira interrogans TaxID=173 RepID=UPI0002BB1F86|nr:hypothetical protein [Leptospira interrogans]
MSENKRSKETLRLVNPKSWKAEKERLFQEGIETFWNDFEKLNSTEKREEVKRLLTTFHRSQKRMETILFQWKDLFEKDREVQRKLRVIGERMRG